MGNIVEMTADEIRGIMSTKLGIRPDMLDVYKDAAGQLDASLRAGPGWTPKQNQEVKQLGAVIGAARHDPFAAASGPGSFLEAPQPQEDRGHTVCR